ncbi:ABC transporter permease [Chloroflexota bacterium]
MAEQTISALTSTPEEPRRRASLAELFTRLVKEKPLGTVGGIIVLTLLIVGIFANLLAPYGMSEMHLEDAFSPPSGQYFLGTDEYGRDMLSRIIFGARISMVVGLAGTTLATVISVIIGLFSGYIGGKFDLVVQRFVDAWLCFPALFIVLTVMAVLGPGMWQVIVVLGIRYGIVGTRVVRSAVISIRENAYMEASIAIGCTTWRIITRHILPNIMAPLIVLFSVRMSAVILMEATISFLGFGIPPPQPSWGGMISGSGREYMLQAPWMIFWPGIALSIVVYGINMFGDAVRDLLDPRLRGGIGRYGVAKRKKQVKSSGV